VLGGLILISSIAVYAASRAEREKTRVLFSSLAFRRIKRRERTEKRENDRDVAGRDFRALRERAVTATRRNRVSSLWDETPVAAALCA